MRVSVARCRGSLSVPWLMCCDSKVVVLRLRSFGNVNFFSLIRNFANQSDDFPNSERTLWALLANGTFMSVSRPQSPRFPDKSTFNSTAEGG